MPAVPVASNSMPEGTEGKTRWQSRCEGL